MNDMRLRRGRSEGLRCDDCSLAFAHVFDFKQNFSLERAFLSRSAYFVLVVHLVFWLFNHWLKRERIEGTSFGIAVSIPSFTSYFSVMNGNDELIKVV